MIVDCDGVVIYVFSWRVVGNNGIVICFKYGFRFNVGVLDVILCCLVGK